MKESPRLRAVRLESRRRKYSAAERQVETNKDRLIRLDNEMKTIQIQMTVAGACLAVLILAITGVVVAALI